MNGCLVPIVILQEDMTLRQSWLWLNIRVFQGRLTFGTAFAGTLIRSVLIVTAHGLALAIMKRA
jgi:hypothetical protein